MASLFEAIAPWYIAILVFVAISRLAELVVSRRNRARMQDGGASPGRDPIFPVMVFVHVMPFWLIPLELLLFDRPFIPAVGYPALALFGLTQLMRLWTLSSLGRYWNAQVMVPDDLDPVTIGPYAYIRHPNYVVVILELLTIPLIHSAWISALALTLSNGLVLFYRIRSEEALLFKSPKYKAAMGDKKRFIPGVF